MSSPLPTAPVPTRRFRLQFGLRWLLGLVCLCCVCLALGNIYVEPYRRQQRLVSEVMKLEATRPAPAKSYGTGCISISIPPVTLGTSKSWTANFFSGLFDDIHSISLIGIPIGDEWVPRLLDAPRLQSLELDSTQVGDAGVVHLSRLRGLTTLSLAQTKITDQGLAQLGRFSQLKHLDLSGCPITDAGMSSLRCLNDLESLGLRDTRISDAGIAQLAKLRKLQSLTLINTDVTEASLAHLKRLPGFDLHELAGTQILPSAIRRTWPERETERLASLLNEPTVVEFVDTPLRDVIDFLYERQQMQIRIDARSLTEANLTLDTPITIARREQSLKQTLWEILHPLRLTYSVEDSRPSQRRLIIKQGARISQSLSRQLHSQRHVQFTDTPLADALNEVLLLRFSLLYAVDPGTLPEAIWDARVTCNSPQVDVATCIEVLLEQLDLHAQLENDTIHLYPGPIPE